jgi:YbbR domain-containing protein
VRWLYANLGYKLIAVAVAFLLWGAAHSSSSVERGFDVPMVLRGIPDDLVIVDQSSDEVNVRIQGSRAAIRNISPGDLEYPVEVSGAKPGVLSVEVDPTPIELPRGARIVSRSPSRVDLTLARRGSKAVKVRADLTGEPAADLRVAEVVVDPPRVRITGAQSEVLRLGEVLTETIDISGATADLEKDAGIALSGSHVWLEEVAPVKVRVRFEPMVPEADAATPPARNGSKTQGGKQG